MDTAVSHALLRRVSEGRAPETLRLHRPSAMVAFGPKDRLAPGFASAVRAAAELGFGAVQRLAGGRAAVFHEETIAFAWVVPDRDPRAGIMARFQEISELLRDALRTLGIDARIGEVPGEYCPGEYSVNARGRTKLMGVGQRLVQHAAHVGGVIVVGGADRVREVLVPVYAALDLEWDPSSTGSLRDEVPSVTWEDAVGSVERAFASLFELIPGDLDRETLDLAGELQPGHALAG